MLKTKAIVIGNSRLINQVCTDQLPSLGDGHNTIKFESSVRTLGVILDSKLFFRQHVASVWSKVNGALYKIQQLREYTDVNLRKCLVSALVMPHVNYCCAALQGISGENNLELQGVANKGIRYIFNVPRDAHISQYRRSLGWLTVAAGRKLAICCLIYTVLKLGVPKFLKDCLSTLVANRPRRGQQGQKLTIPFYRTDTFMHSFAVSAPSYWNSIPSDIQQSTSRSVFRAALKKVLLAEELAEAAAVTTLQQICSNGITLN